MNDIKRIKQEIQMQEDIKNRISELINEIREFKRDYEANRAKILCNTVNSNTSIDDVLNIRTKYESCSQTLTTLDEARGYISREIDSLNEQLGIVSSTIVSKRTEDEFKSIVRELNGDKFNPKLKMKFIQHCTNYMGMNKREAYEEMEKVLDTTVIFKA